MPVSAVKPGRMADLTSEGIAAAALALLDAKGMDGFTMRGVAEALGVTPMALYHHVKDKAALAMLVVEAATRERVLPPTTGDWREDLWVLADWGRQSTLAHPAVGRLRGTYRIWTPAILQMSERWMSLWQQSGLPVEAATRAASMSSQAIVGMVDQELVLREMAAPDERLLAWLPNTRLAFTADRDRDGDFKMMVHALIGGLYESLSKGA